MRMDMPMAQPVGAARVAVLVDGENIAAGAAEAALHAGAGLGRVAVRRVYRNAATASAWDAAAGFHTVHTGNVRCKNAADMALAIDAVELGLRGQAAGFVLVTSDGDFTRLACWLRENGFAVTGLGEAKAPAGFRAACDRFVEWSPCEAPSAPVVQQPVAKPAPKPMPSPALLGQVDALLLDVARNDWLPICQLGSMMGQRHGIRISQTPHGNWRAVLATHPDRYELEPKSAVARVRLRQRAP